MLVLNYSGHTSSTPATFHGFVLFTASLTSCYCDLPRSISSISSDSIILSYFTGFVGSSLFNISLKCSTHLCSVSCVSVLSILCLALTPTSCVCHLPVIDLVMPNSSLNSSYLSQLPFPLLQLSSLTNFSSLPFHSFSLECFSHYTSLSISFSVISILYPPFSVTPLSSPWCFPTVCFLSMPYCMLTKS